MSPCGQSPNWEQKWTWISNKTEIILQIFLLKQEHEQVWDL